MPSAFWEVTKNIFNACSGYFPKRWKKGVIIPLPKKKEARSLSDLRPITLLSTWGKCLERVIMNGIMNEDGEIPGMPANQFAYRKGHSATDAVRLVQMELEANSQSNATTAVIALACSKHSTPSGRKV